MGVWERHLTAGDLFVDVGANIGMYVLFALDLGAEVIAFEPDPGSVRRLRENLSLNGYTAEIIEKAATDRVGEIRFTVGLDSYNRIVLEPTRGEITRTVPTTTLDAVLGTRRAAGLKLDVEGAERLVLQGAVQALAEHRIGLIQLEWSGPESTRTLGETREPIARLLRAHGYALFAADRQSAELHEMTSADFDERDVFAKPAP